MRTSLRGCFKKGCTPWNKGKANLYSQEHLKTLSDKGKANAEKRWNGHIKVNSNRVKNLNPICQSCNTRKYTKIISYLPSSPSDLIYAEEGLVN
jgi:hypothetical protein